MSKWGTHDSELALKIALYGVLPFVVLPLTAQAHEDNPAPQVESPSVATTHLSAAWVPRGTDLGLRSVGQKDAYLGVEARITTDGVWMGRAGLGFDVLGKSPLDLKLGLFAGSTGFEDLNQGYALRPQFGSDISIGGEMGRLYGHARWLHGFTSTVGWMNETQLLAGYRIVGQTRLFGEYLAYNTDCCGRGGFGVGVDVSF